MKKIFKEKELIEILKILEKNIKNISSRLKKT